MASKNQANVNLRSIQKFQVLKKRGWFPKMQDAAFAFLLATFGIHSRYKKLITWMARQSLSGGPSTDAPHLSAETGRNSLENVVA